MFTIYLGFAGVLVFVAGTAILGSWLRRHPSEDHAEKSSRIMHFLFFLVWLGPALVAVFYPGLTHFDDLVGWQPLPWKPVFLALGILLAVPGLYLLAVTNKLLRALGRGANAFRLTKQIVADDIYKRTRNPMSLGLYLFQLAVAFLLGSTFITFAVLCLILAHLFFLKYFEEEELTLRFGDSYLQYKQAVPFLFPRWGSTT